MSKDLLKLAMIGSGQISDRFFKQAQQLDSVKFVATQSRNLIHAEAKAREFGIERTYADYKRMMDEERPDGVIVTTPHSLHAEPALAALKRGIHVLVEKPMATAFSDAQAMVVAARSAGVVLMSLPFDGSPAFGIAREWIREEYLGKVTGAEAQLAIPGPPRNNWYYDRAIAHGGAVFDCLPYPISRLLTLLGPAASLTAEMNTLIPHRLLPEEGMVESTVDDNVSLILQFKNGQHALVRTLWGIAFGQNNTIIYGRHGTLALNDGGYPVVLHSPEVAVSGAKRVVWRGLQDCYVPQDLPALQPDFDIVGRFIHAIRTGEPLRQGPDLSLHVIETVCGAIQSAGDGQRYTMTTSFEPDVPASLFDTRTAPI